MDMAGDGRQEPPNHWLLRRGSQSQKRPEMVANIPKVYRQQATFYTDQYVVYVGVIPTAQHQPIGKLARKTNHIERFNNTLRQRVSRRVRSALSFSKKFSNHIGAIKYFICVRRVKSLRRLSSRNRGRGLVIQLTVA